MILGRVAIEKFFGASLIGKQLVMKSVDERLHCQFFIAYKFAGKACDVCVVDGDQGLDIAVVGQDGCVIAAPM